jgi:hypothetical protein
VFSLYSGCPVFSNTHSRGLHVHDATLAWNVEFTATAIPGVLLTVMYAERVA